MKKKILSLILALLMASSSAAFAAADDAVTLAASENPYAASAEFLNAQGIMKGKTDGELDLALNDNVKRYEMALFVSRITMGGEWLNDAAWANVDVPAIYTDLAGSGAMNVKGALHFATSKGIIEGYGNGEFGPEETVTYQDALTMVVRTLGFTGLDWPWEYIQKAIDLGLTKNIDAAKTYTSAMNRGEVAQLIYNALYTVKKDGATLAAEVFNMKEAAVIITATDRIVFEKGASVAPANKVAFKLYDVATGAIGNETYYASAAEFGFVEYDAEGKENIKKNAMNQAVGHLYKVLLNTDDNGNVTADAEGIYVKNLMEASDYSTPISNRAYEVVKGEDGKVIASAIEAALKDLKLSTKYTRAADEVVIYGNTGNAVVSSTTSIGVAMDWYTGDILQQCDANDPAKSHEVDGKSYKVAWYYNKTLNKYYQIKKDINDTTAVGFIWLDDAELEAIVASLKSTTTAVQALNLLSAKEIKAGTAYADLTLESFADGKALQGVYTEYKLGYLVNAKKKCAACDVDQAGIKIYDVLEEMNIAEEDVESFTRGTKFSAEPVVVEAKPHTKKDGCTNASLWTTTAIPSVDCYVIYSYNEVTKELKIVETVQTIKGVLRGYSTKNELVLIDNAKYALGFDNLLGSSFIMNDGTSKEDKALRQTQVENYLDGLDALLNEYVECAVINGKIVSMRTAEKASATEKYIIMQGYVGNTADGEMVVEAYAASNGALNQYIVDNFDDASIREYAMVADNESLAKAEFAVGNLYYVSYMDGNRVEIEKVGGYTDGKFALIPGKVTTTALKVSFNEFGDKMVAGKEETNDGTYIVIAQDYVEGKAPITVYTGEVYDLEWEISGQILKSVTTANVFVSTAKCVGFDEDAYKHGMYLYAGGNIYDQVNGKDDYNTMYGEEAVLVPTVSYIDIDMIDLYTGKVTRQTLRNMTKKDFEAGTIYLTIEGENGILSVQGEQDGAAFLDAMQDVFYKDTYVGVARNDAMTSADYLFGTGVATKALTAANVLDKLVADGHYANKSFAKLTKANLTQNIITVDENGDVALADLEAYLTANAGENVTFTIEYTYVYSTKNDTAAIYATKVTKEVAEAPATEAPATEAPATEAPATEAPATEAPATEAPATEAPETAAPAETTTPVAPQTFDFGVIAAAAAVVSAAGYAIARKRK